MGTLEALLAHGMDPGTPAAVVARGGHPDQEVLTAPPAGIARVAESVRPPAVTVIGEVARWASAAQEEETR